MLRAEIVYEEKIQPLLTIIAVITMVLSLQISAQLANNRTGHLTDEFFTLILANANLSISLPIEKCIFISQTKHQYGLYI